MSERTKDDDKMEELRKLAKVQKPAKFDEEREYYRVPNRNQSLLSEIFGSMQCQQRKVHEKVKKKYIIYLGMKMLFFNKFMHY